jgi:cyclohexadienyl dehydratase
MKRSLLGGVLAVFVALTISCGTSPNDRSGTNIRPADISVLDQVAHEKVLRIGFSGYPPYLRVDPATNLPADGFSVDLIKAILAEWDAQIRIIWVQTNWTDLRVDLNNRKFDLFIEPVFRTIPRAAIVAFSRPFAYFPYAVGVVRAGDNRFKSILDLNNPSVRICVMQSGTSHEYAKKNLPGATNLKVLSGGNLESTLDEVLLGRVDITLIDLHTARRYVAAHPGKVKIIFTDPPPARAPAGLMFRQGDYKWAAFLDTCLEYLEASGEVDRLKKKYALEE